MQEEHCPPGRRIARDRAGTRDDAVSPDLQPSIDRRGESRRGPAALPEDRAGEQRNDD
jgi:hypothetical protein